MSKPPEEKRIGVDSYTIRPSILVLDDGAEFSIYPSISDVARVIGAVNPAGEPVYNIRHGLQITMTKQPDTEHKGPAFLEPVK